MLDLLPVESWRLPIDARVRSWLRLELEFHPECSVLQAVPGSSRMYEHVLAWSDALDRFGVGLTALRVFHGLKPIRAAQGRGRSDFHGLSRFPDWAVQDVLALPPISALAAAAEAASAVSGGRGRGFLP